MDEKLNLDTVEVIFYILLASLLTSLILAVANTIYIFGQEDTLEQYCASFDAEWVELGDINYCLADNELTQIEWINE